MGSSASVCGKKMGLNCLSAGSVSLTSVLPQPRDGAFGSQLPFGWVCFSNLVPDEAETCELEHVSIAFRLGLFL